MKPATQPPGLPISIRIACTPMVSSRKTMLGLVSIASNCSMKLAATSSVRALLVSSVRGSVRQLDLETVQLSQQIVQVFGDEIDQAGFQRFVGGNCFGCFDGRFGQCDGFFAAPFSQRADGGLGDFLGLGLHGFAQVFALPAHRAGRTDGRLGRHGSGVPGQRDDRPGAAGPGPARGYIRPPPGYRSRG